MDDSYGELQSRLKDIGLNERSRHNFQFPWAVKVDRGDLMHEEQGATRLRKAHSWETLLSGSVDYLLSCLRADSRLAWYASLVLAVILALAG